MWQNYYFKILNQRVEVTLVLSSQVKSIRQVLVFVTNFVKQISWLNGLMHALPQTWMEFKMNELNCQQTWKVWLLQD